MEKSERWFSSVTLVVSILPVILIGVVRNFLPTQFEIIDTTTNATFSFNKDRFFFVGFFCLIPLSILLVARFMRTRGLIVRNFNGTVLGTLLLSGVYLGVIVYILVFSLISSQEFVAKMNLTSLIFTILCLSLSIASNALPSPKPNPFLGVTKAGAAGDDFWYKISSAAASFLTYLFMAAGVISAFVCDIIPPIIFAASFIIYYIWMALYSKHLINMRAAEIGSL